ncbi:MAG: class II aldolase [Anderseniella sp.]|nr:class II aldolase [Anderseniella sp.]
MSDEASLRRAVVETAQAMSAKGLSPQRSGNVSVRIGDSILVTPTGLPYADYQPADMVKMSMDGVIAEDQKKPSSEAPFHLAIYNAFPDAKAIVHCHSMAATALACARMDIPAFHYMVAVAGGKKIPLADYATFGTDELATSAVASLSGGYKACLLANHGQIAFAGNLGKALELAGEVETLARQYIDVLSLGGGHVLDDAEMDRVIARFKSYGKQA